MHNKDIKIYTYRAGQWEQHLTKVIREQPVTLTVNNVPWLTFMCTPIDLESLAIGFLFNEEIIQTMEDVASVRVCPGSDNVDVWLYRSVKIPEKWIRTSGCSGGKTSIQETKNQPSGGIPKNGALLSPEVIASLTNQLIEVQDLYKQSGGVHTSALSDGEEILAVAEDIGRHNTLDKLAGRCLLDQIQPKKRIILTTGRISSEMIQKTGRLGASVVISRTSPTSLSIRIAEELGITMIGYARRDHFTVYTHPERVLTVPVSEPIYHEAK